MKPLAILLLGIVLGASIPVAYADTAQNEVVEIRRAIQSIARSLERCSQ